MPSTFRIPRAHVTGLYGRLMTAYARRTWGQVPDNAYVLWHHRPVLRSVLAFERSLARWNRLDRHLKTYAVLASACVIGCSWCLDFGYFLAHTEGLDESKVREVPRWRESEVFTGLERDVMEYAEAMTRTPLTVTDEMVASLVDRLGPAAVVELTEMIDVENQRSRFNAAAGMASQGFSSICELPLTAPSSVAAG